MSYRTGTDSAVSALLSKYATLQPTETRQIHAVQQACMEAGLDLNKEQIRCNTYGKAYIDASPLKKHFLYKSKSQIVESAQQKESSLVDFF